MVLISQVKPIHRRSLAVLVALLIFSSTAEAQDGSNTRPQWGRWAPQMGLSSWNENLFLQSSDGEQFNVKSNFFGMNVGLSLNRGYRRLAWGIDASLLLGLQHATTTGLPGSFSSPAPDYSARNVPSFGVSSAACGQVKSRGGRSAFGLCVPMIWRHSPWPSSGAYAVNSSSRVLTGLLFEVELSRNWLLIKQRAGFLNDWRHWVWMIDFGAQGLF